MKKLKKLKKEAFKSFVKNKAEQYVNDFPQYANCTVSAMEINKINGKKEGLLFKTQGAEIGPYMNLDKAYKEYLNTNYSDEAWVTSYVTSFLEKAANISEQKFANAEQAIDAIKQSKMIPALINKDFNKEYLKHFVYKDIPGTEFVAIVRAIVDITNDGIMSSIVSKNLLKTLGYTEDKLWELATSDLEVQVVPMADIILDSMAKEEMPKEIIDDMRKRLRNEVPWFVLTNKLRYYASGSIINSKVLSGICEVIGSFYIIPSSVHDLILIPEEIIDMKSPDIEIEQFIQAVNKDDHLISSEEVLSNKLYYYSEETGLKLAFEQ